MNIYKVNFEVSYITGPYKRYHCFERYVRAGDSVRAFGIIITEMLRRFNNLPKYIDCEQMDIEWEYYDFTD